MSTKNLHTRVATAFKRIIKVAGYPVHYFAYGVEVAAILLEHSGLLVPTHAFLSSDHALLCANVMLAVLLHLHHNRHQTDE